MQKIIFTDLDGTLLNHSDYRFDDAADALRRIGQHGYPLIIVSSKTAEEIKILQKKIGLCEPFICENGAAIVIPSAYKKLGKTPEETEHGYTRIVLGSAYKDLVAFLTPFKKPLGIRGFSDMDTEEVAQLTGLGLESALLAKRRQYTEPFIIKNEAFMDILTPEAVRAGYSITRGGRFFHQRQRGGGQQSPGAF